MKLLFNAFALALLVSLCASGQTNPPSSALSRPTIETIVCIRHGEKPKEGLGQLSCRGLNRALALPQVLLGKYGPPQYVFAPSTTQKTDSGTNYDYVRPLATIEPLAIRCGLPVNTQFPFQEIKGLQRELRKPKYSNAVIYLAWEHSLLDELVKNLVKDAGGDATQVPAWPGTDFDTIFLVKITHSDHGNSVTFAIDHEGLDNLSDTCP